ncbi:hypothetical protein [Novosphingobium terrae]|uniref:hypothetical protein n=1 Tax=Novosphingobium terrae TaxID=2726189 RepID=UPI001F1386E3|nr:hypothetical protein [Novosphingobium terrae]
MITNAPDTPVSPLRQRMIEDMNLRFARKTQCDYVNHVALCHLSCTSLGYRDSERFASLPD